MKIDANDPRWTAYALGEITDEKEKAELESILTESSEARQLVEEIRNAGDLLSSELHAEPGIGLTHAQRQKIEDKASAPRRWFGMRPAWVMAGAAAAVLLIAFVAVRQLRQAPQASPQIQIAEVKPAGTAGVPPATANTQAPAQITPQRASRPGSQAVEPTPPVIPPEPVTKAKLKESKPPEMPSPAQQEQPAAPSQAVPPVIAQNNAILAGTVTDASGAMIPGAKVTITDKLTGLKLITATNNAGIYTFPSIKPGDYSVTAEMPGFQTQTMTDVKLAANMPGRLNYQMSVQGVATRIEVNTASHDLLMESASSTGELKPVATVAPPPPQSRIIRTPFGEIRGVPAGQVNVARDGISVNDVRYASGLGKGAKTYSEIVGEFRLILSPVERERMREYYRRQRGDFNTEAYDHIRDNMFLDVEQNPLSTFSIDVDTASYSNMRRFIETGKLPPKDSIRIEELVNYFDYNYKPPTDNKPFAVNFEVTEAPWQPEHKLLRIGIKGREVNPARRPSGNLVFLLDVSGSMSDSNKLPLVKQSMELLLQQLTEADRIAIVVYATESDVILNSTRGDQKEKIRRVIDGLRANGTTNGASGIQLAYRIARENFIRGGTNRVILATDGDFNVGITNRGDLTRLIEEEAKSGIFLSALGFGMGNLKDATLESLAKYGHGNYAYIDTLEEAKKVLVEQVNGTLVPIAKDVKIQVEFNPARVGAYRLIGYEDRVMAKEDFNNDKKEAGVIGSGHTVTALYEIVPTGTPVDSSVDPLKYQKPSKQASAAPYSDELLTVKIRSKEPEGNESVLSAFPVKESKEKFSDASKDFKFAVAVAAFGMVLRDSPYKGNADLQRALDWARQGLGEDKHGYRTEFVRLIHRTMSSLAF